ncbi:hypothetical protein GIB67_007184 [Kingdonia uniflora]|uniref:W2 domain-containing protein n=1 Tax=Kingdonia uniflora TaxID=39325 RepID=A0A7J7ND73_9MAGN|nr:hypothetical protein GIB67_007184 [Kingdonia uniflora]
MALQNIGAGNSDDAFYRYKMPKMITKVEGRGNGIKTNVVNMTDIGKALARPASYPIKYFGCELGAQSKFDEKTGVALVNGSHDTAKLAGLLENFIKKYVQCYGCGNPETEVIITKTQMIQLKCAACGFLSDVDMRDKLTTFILKNPPEQKKGSSKDKKAMRRAEKERLKEGEAADEELKKTKKEVKKKSSAKDNIQKVAAVPNKKVASDEDRSPSPGSQDDENEAEVDEEEEDIQWQTDTSVAAARQRIQEQLSSVTADMVMLSTDEPGKEKPKPNTKPTGVGNGKNQHEILVKEIKGCLKNYRATTPLTLLESLKSLEGTPQEVMTAFFHALFEGVEKGFSKEVTKKKNLLVLLTHESKESQTFLLRAIEDFVGKPGSDSVKEVALVMKVLYDADVLEEEFIVQWYETGLAGENQNSPIWKNLKPFIEWLKSAESESDDE